eukprot:Rhum_TRINITY_DN14673_c32_g1::Rhum_TRINITY_DN14673_c32_g1_i1::g.108248::m.108248
MLNLLVEGLLHAAPLLLLSPLEGNALLLQNTVVLLRRLFLDAQSLLRQHRAQARVVVRLHPLRAQVRRSLRRLLAAPQRALHRRQPVLQLRVVLAQHRALLLVRQRLVARRHVGQHAAELRHVALVRTPRGGGRRRLRRSAPRTARTARLADGRVACQQREPLHEEQRFVAQRGSGGRWGRRQRRRRRRRAQQRQRGRRRQRRTVQGTGTHARYPPRAHPRRHHVCPAAARPLRKGVDGGGGRGGRRRRCRRQQVGSNPQLARPQPQLLEQRGLPALRRAHVVPQRVADAAARACVAGGRHPLFLLFLLLLLLL